MAQRAYRKHGLSGATRPGRTTASRTLTVAVVLLVAAAPLVAGVAVGAPSAAAGPASATAGGAAASVDVVFVFDSSASTNEDRYHVAQEIDELADRFGDAGVDARYGLVTYSDTVRTEQPLTSDFDAFEKAMHFPESGNVEHASEGILTATGMAFRDDAERVVVVVTDEDDDSSNATRADALSSLSGVHFVAVSPADPYESSCAVHSEPCDNRTDNELRTMADEVGGDWVDQSQDADAVVDAVTDSIVAQVDTGGGSGGSSAASPEFVTANQSVDPTTAEVGDRVTVRKTVENRGGADGTYEAYLSRAGTILAEKTVTIPAGESRTITFGHRFDDPGEYELLVTHEAVGTVTVTEPNDERVETATDGAGVRATVADAWPNSSVRIPVGDADLTPTGAADVEAVVVSVGDVNATPAHDVAFDVALAANATPPADVAPLPTHVTNTTYLRLNSSLGDELDGVAFEFVPAANGTTLYRYDANESAWVPLDAAAVNGTDGALRTHASDGSLYAVGVRRPAVDLNGVEFGATNLTVGETTAVTVTVANDGAAAGTYNATLRVNGSVVDAEWVAVPADASRTVVFTFTPERPGNHAVDVSNASARTLQVGPAPTPTPTASPTPTPTATATPPPATATATAAGTGTSSPTTTPGFGFALALAALAAAALLAGRRE